MARKPTHFTAHTNEEMHLRFEAAVEQLGMSVDASDSRMHDLTIDGVRLSDKAAASDAKSSRLRFPQT